MDSAADSVEKAHRKVLSDLAWALHKLPPKTYSLSAVFNAQRVGLRRLGRGLLGEG